MNPKYILIAINEAKKSKDSDNYWVGAVIVKNDKVISQAYGNESQNKSNAEELAIKNCKKDLTDSTTYVTMEPCDYRNFGKKSCCDLIINSGIKEIIYGVLDPREECHGIEKLKKAGIKVKHFKDFEEECKQITPNLKWD